MAGTLPSRLRHSSLVSHTSPREQYFSDEIHRQRALQIQEQGTMREALNRVVETEVRQGINDREQELAGQSRRLDRKLSECRAYYDAVAEREEQLDRREKKLDERERQLVVGERRLVQEGRAQEEEERRRRHELDTYEGVLRAKSEAHEWKVQQLRNSRMHSHSELDALPRFPPPALRLQLADSKQTLEELKGIISAQNFHISGLMDQAYTLKQLNAELKKRNDDLKERYLQQLAFIRHEVGTLRAQKSTWNREERTKLTRWKRQLTEWWEKRYTEASGHANSADTPKPPPPLDALARHSVDLKSVGSPSMRSRLHSLVSFDSSGYNRQAQPNNDEPLRSLDTARTHAGESLQDELADLKETP